MSEPTSTCAGAWGVSEEVESDFSKPPASDDEMGWEPSGTFVETSTFTPDLSQWREQFDERIKTKAWVMRLRCGWKEQESCPTHLAESFTRVFGKRDFNGFSVVYGEQPVSHVYTYTMSREYTYTVRGTTIVMPSADVGNEARPADLLADIGTDISHLLQVPYTCVDSKAMLTSTLDALPTYHSQVPLLSIDHEGFNLRKKNGETYLIQIYDSLTPSQHRRCLDARV